MFELELMISMFSTYLSFFLRFFFLDEDEDELLRQPHLSAAINSLCSCLVLQPFA
jgi:hypothetical protein